MLDSVGNALVVHQGGASTDFATQPTFPQAPPWTAHATVRESVMRNQNHHTRPFKKRAKLRQGRCDPVCDGTPHKQKENERITNQHARSMNIGSIMGPRPPTTAKHDKKSTRKPKAGQDRPDTTAQQQELATNKAASPQQAETQGGHHQRQTRALARSAPRGARGLSCRRRLRSARIRCSAATMVTPARGSSPWAC